MTSSKMNLENENGAVKKSSDFSIEHILNKAGDSMSKDVNKSVSNCDKGEHNLKKYEVADNVGLMGYGHFGYVSNEVPFTWLQCSRYCPPKVPRKREGPQRRQLGRHPRIPFSTQQLSILEDKFKVTPYLSSEEVTKISRILQLADIRVKIWFQNRRARERRERPQLEQQISPGPQVGVLGLQPNQSTSINVSNQNHLHESFHLPPNIIPSGGDFTIKQEPYL